MYIWTGEKDKIWLTERFNLSQASLIVVLFLMRNIATYQW